MRELISPVAVNCIVIYKQFNVWLAFDAILNTVVIQRYPFLLLSEYGSHPVSGLIRVVEQ